ncbi:hypothetical protein Zm00014a_033117 [Zea mays]|uniref:Uncharacterized protein n=1 Tax=Zea mays TaxID=4577 RepID=A0A3L6D6W0_MAIZE|nr:hypothetical protein Zm00014a_033117 [Zea mays]
MVAPLSRALLHACAPFGSLRRALRCCAPWSSSSSCFFSSAPSSAPSSLQKLPAMAPAGRMWIPLPRRSSRLLSSSPRPTTERTSRLDTTARARPCSPFCLLPWRLPCRAPKPSQPSSSPPLHLPRSRFPDLLFAWLAARSSSFSARRPFPPVAVPSARSVLPGTRSYAPIARLAHGHRPSSSPCVRGPLPELPARLLRSAGGQSLLLAARAFLCSAMAARRRSSFAASRFLPAGHSSKSLPL